MSPDHSEIDAAARKHSTQGREMLPRFHPACFPWKTILIHVMITESPCRIRAAPRWSSVSRTTGSSHRADPSLRSADSLLSSSTLSLHRLFYRTRICPVKKESQSAHLSTLNPYVSPISVRTSLHSQPVRPSDAADVLFFHIRRKRRNVRCASVSVTLFG